jgi:hypothetical protein
MMEQGRIFSVLYREEEPPGNPIPVYYHPVPVPDGCPDEDKVAATIQKLRSGKAPGPTGLHMDELKEWAENRGGEPWKNLVRVVQHCFTTGEVPQWLSFATLVLIPKSDGGARGIGLLKSIWKVILGISSSNL